MAAISLFEYLDEAWNTNNENLLHSGTYRSSLFDFVRLAKAHSDLRDLGAMEALNAVERWAESRGGWMNLPFEGAIADMLSDDDFEAEFITVWEEVQYPAGEGPLELAFRKAKELPLKMTGPKSGVKGYMSFLSLAAYLQVLRGDNPIFLPCRRVGELLGCSAMTISQYRRWAIRGHLLKVVREHGTGAAVRSATEFRFVIERFPGMRPKAGS